MTDVNRREFLTALGLGAAALAVDPARAALSAESAEVKPIHGSWFEFQHHATVEGVDWNPALVQFTAEQWDQKIREMADAGLEYLVLMATAVYYRSFYDSKIYPKWKLACADPLEAVLAAADKYKVKFFIGAGFYGNWESDRVIVDPVAHRQRLQSLGELASLYGHHPSFYGWYWPDEAFIDKHYSPDFIAYVNALSHEARQLKREAPIMIAPYGTRVAVPDDEYVRQLDSMDVNIVAYQDEVGVRKSKVTETSAFYRGLRKAHDRTDKAKMWADMEIFEFEGEVYNSALMPAPFDRVRRQLEAVSPWVDQILVYQYLGLMNRPGSSAFAGSPQSTQLYSDYMTWRNRRV
ncbi:MAG TPA: DUF4434 domain-containing protein [Acidobacteriaceae bacterium]|jgi:hypothetical protein|nr:DUF4434 domain-containing protein [Acidobacteriaceae bacterium]